MIRIATTLSDEDIVRALHKQPRDVLLAFTKDLLTNYRDSTLLEEVADAVLAELERRASSR